MDPEYLKEAAKKAKKPKIAKKAPKDVALELEALRLGERVLPGRVCPPLAGLPRVLFGGYARQQLDVQRDDPNEAVAVSRGKLLHKRGAEGLPGRALRGYHGAAL